MRYYKYFILLFLILFSFQGFAKSCEKNGTCRGRFELQKDPYDFQRESSRAHMALFFMSGFVINRLLDSDLFAERFGRKLSKNERILYTALGLTVAGLIKELAYDPDGLSRSDVASNSMGIGLSMAFEFTLF